MNPEWDIGQQSQDLRVISHIAEVVCGLPDDCRWSGDWAAERESLRARCGPSDDCSWSDDWIPGRHALEVRGETIRVRVWFVPDRILDKSYRARALGERRAAPRYRGGGVRHAQEGAIQLDVKLGSSRGPWPRTWKPDSRPWTLSVRCDVEARKDNISRRYKKLGKALRRGLAETPVPPGASTWRKTGHLWFRPKRESRNVRDLTAEIAVFVLHTDLPSETSRGQIREWLHSYVKRDFRATDTEAEQTVAALRYFRPPGAKSWRVYVRRCLYHTMARRERRQRVFRISVGEISSGADTRRPTGNGRSDTPIQRAATSALSLKEAAGALGVGRSTLYELIQKGRVVVQPRSVGTSRILIAPIEVARLKASRLPKPKAAIEMRQRIPGVRAALRESGCTVSCKGGQEWRKSQVAWRPGRDS